MKEEILRVNHAGETAAKYIYKSQIRFTSNKYLRKELKEMYLQEKEHLEYFIEELRENAVRPTALLPLWKLLSKFLGCSSALMGEKYVMLTTEAVEEVIDLHYKKQLEILDRFYPEKIELYEKIKKFRDDEILHKENAQKSIEHYNIADILFSYLVKRGCNGAIFLSRLL